MNVSMVLVQCMYEAKLFTGLGAAYVTKPYDLIWFGDSNGLNPHENMCFVYGPCNNHWEIDRE